MADISLPATQVRRVATAVTNVVVAADRVLHGQLVSAAAVAGVAFALRVLGIELQYVAGAFVIVFAQRLSNKRFNREVIVPPAETPRGSAKDFLKQPKDPIADALAQ
jgi:hypothetical protein